MISTEDMIQYIFYEEITQKAGPGTKTAVHRKQQTFKLSNSVIKSSSIINEHTLKLILDMKRAFRLYFEKYFCKWKKYFRYWWQHGLLHF